MMDGQHDETILEVRDVSHIYSKGTPFEQMALDHVSLSVKKGEFIAMIGHTGSGKSTLIQHLNGLLKPASGQVLFHGTDIFAKEADLRAIRFRIGLVFQYPEYQLFEETVGQDIAYGPTNMGLEREEIDRRVRDALDAVGLPQEISQKSPFELSGGQKRRVALAGVIAMQPEILVLDEPTAGLDPAGREEMFGLIRKLHDSRGTTIILVTHSMEDAARIASRLVVLKQGRIYMTGTPAEVFAQAEALEQSGLAVPQVTRILLELRRRGIPVRTDCFTVEQAAIELLRCKEGGAIC
ncbi:MAG: energy-coupling factor transporter ATPase [Eubacteriales bacterium]|nr:energy-coupling factor transporter ATPase [Eubacteriales bacterium]